MLLLLLAGCGRECNSNCDVYFVAKKDWLPVIEQASWKDGRLTLHLERSSRFPKGYFFLSMFLQKGDSLFRMEMNHRVDTDISIGQVVITADDAKLIFENDVWEKDAAAVSYYKRLVRDGFTFRGARVDFNLDMAVFLQEEPLPRMTYRRACFMQDVYTDSVSAPLLGRYVLLDAPGVDDLTSKKLLKKTDRIISDCKTSPQEYVPHTFSDWEELKCSLRLRMNETLY